MGTTNWTGIGREILDKYLQSEKGGGSDAGQFGLDIFNNGFEDEFPGDSEDPAAGTYQGYSLEANRASETRPWGGKFGERPKIHELNQPPAAQALGWRVIDFYPNRDVKSEFYRLAGTPSELRIMMQIVQATRFVLGSRLNFKEWFEQWEKGFPDFDQNRSDSNFLLSGEKQWERIKKPESRPRYREFTNSQQRADLGYRVIEYWRDRSIESSSIILSGTDLQIMNHIIQIEYEGGGGSDDFLPYDIEEERLRHPLVILTFKEVTTQNKRPRVYKQWFRLMSQTENPELAEQKQSNLLSLSDIRQLAQKIKDIFMPLGVRFEFSKGRTRYRYLDKNLGYDIRSYARNRNNMKKLVAAILNIQNHAIIPKLLKATTAEEDTLLEAPRTLTVLGKSVEIAEKHPQIEVAFYEATLRLGLLNTPIYLVSRDGSVFQDLLK